MGDASTPMERAPRETEQRRNGRVAPAPAPGGAASAVASCNASAQDSRACARARGTPRRRNAMQTDPIETRSVAPASVGVGRGWDHHTQGPRGRQICSATLWKRCRRKSKRCYHTSKLWALRDFWGMTCFLEVANCRGHGCLCFPGWWFPSRCATPAGPMVVKPVPGSPI